MQQELAELQGKGVVDALRSQQKSVSLSPTEEAFVFEDDRERCKIAMDYIHGQIDMKKNLIHGKKVNFLNV